MNVFKSLMGRRQFMIAAGLASTSVLYGRKLAMGAGPAAPPPSASGVKRKLLTFKRNVFTAEERAALDAWRKLEYKSGGGFGGTGIASAQPKDFDTVSGFEMYYYAKGWDKYNPLWHDYNYAKNTWYGDCPAIPTIREPIAMAALPSELGFESRGPGDPLVGDGYDFELYYYKPIFSGDSFTTKTTGLDLVDLTEDGADYRFMIAIVKAEMFNQKNEMVCRAVMHWPCIRQKYEDGHVPTREEMMQQRSGGGPQEQYTRPAHVYTDADWDFLKDIWAKEKVRGAETLYWEDVKVGDEPQWTAENPVTDYDARRYTGFHHTVGAIAGDSARDFIMNGNSERRFYKRDDGVYDVAGSDRTHFLNFVGRNFCLRTITNWCGDDGFVRKVGWRMVNDFPPAKQFDHFPEGHFRESWLLKVPYLKKAGKFTNTHGMGPDCAICKAYVTEKFIDPDTGDHMVMLTGWAEDMDGNIFQECEFSVALPTRS
jgi:hypothetical protein